MIPGDDAAPEAMSASLRVLEALDLPIDWDHIPVGDELASLAPTERESLVGEHIDNSDTVLFGSSNGTTPGAGFMRWGKKTYANVRPVRWRPGYASPLARPEGIDYVIVRENLEDMYVGVMGPAKLLLDAGLTDGRSRVPPDAANGRFAAKIITRPGTEQVTRFACELALSRGGKLTVSAKTNMLPATDRWFCDIAREVASEYPGLEYEQFIIDDMAHRLVMRPHDLDVGPTTSMCCCCPICTATSSPTRAPAPSGAWAWHRRAATATTGRTSNRRTAPHPTSPARASSTRPRRWNPPR